MALSPATHKERTGLEPAGRVNLRAGMDRAVRVANPTFLKNYDLVCRLWQVEPKKALSEQRPEYTRQLAGPLNDANFPGDDETVFKYWLEAMFHQDHHLLVKQWSDQYTGGAGNFVAPSVRQGWGRKPEIEYRVVITDAEDHERLAREHVKKSSQYDGGNLGQSFLAHVDPEEWRQQRAHLISPMLPKTVFANILPRMEASAHELVQRIRSGESSTFFAGSVAPEEALNIHELVLDTAFRILCRTLFGEEDHFIIANSKRVRWALQNPVKQGKSFDIIREWTTQLLKRAQARLTADPSGEILAEQGPVLREAVGTGEIFKSTIAGAEGAEQTLHDNLGILTFAGHDTTGNTMCWCLMELARNRDAQKACQTELDAVFAELGPEGFTYNDFHKMPYLTKCINETLRKWSVVAYGTWRELMHDEVVRGPADEMVTLPAGTTVMLPNFCQGRSERLWGHDADVWRPDRFEGFPDPDGSSIHFEDAMPSFSTKNPESRRFHPFTRSPRDCYGKNFAQAEMRVVLAHLLNEFEFRLAEPTKSLVAQNQDQIGFEVAGILKPRDGLWMHVKPRRRPSML